MMSRRSRSSSNLAVQITFAATFLLAIAVAGWLRLNGSMNIGFALLLMLCVVAATVVVANLGDRKNP